MNPMRQMRERPAGEATSASGDWFERMSVHGALVAVDMDQRVVRASDQTGEIFPCLDEVLGKRCYEVMTSLDARNADLCRPNCAVMVAARRGHAFPDFQVWTGDGTDDAASDVSILLRDAEDDDDERLALHYVRRGRTHDRRDAHAPGHVCAALGMLSEESPADAEPQAPLTARQYQVLSRLAAGLSPAEIAQELELRPITVRNHLQAAMERLGARTRLEAVLTAARTGLL
ncbi:MAG: LuxR C-terminal-related transcriptional regulator [Dehalococcoidia bacterium]